MNGKFVLQTGTAGFFCCGKIAGCNCRIPSCFPGMLQGNILMQPGIGLAAAGKRPVRKKDQETAIRTFQPYKQLAMNDEHCRRKFPEEMKGGDGLCVR